MDEKWIDIEDYEGIYKISNYGRIASIGRMVFNGSGMRLSKGRILKQQLNNKGYNFIILSVNNVKKKYFIHRLVAFAFIPNKNNLPCVNHIDSNPTNNKAENLEWVTYKGNIQHAIEAGRFHKSFAMTNEKFKEDRENKMRAVIGTNLKTGMEVYYNSIQSAGRDFNGRAGDICNVCKGYRQSAQGYKWEYADIKNIKEGDHER